MQGTSFRYLILLIVAMSLMQLCLFCKKLSTGLTINNNECDPTEYIDTTRSYFYYYFDEKIYLTLATDIFLALYDSTVDIEKANQNLLKYDITTIYRFPSDNSLFLKAPEGKRAEEFYTSYGYDTDCGFGNQEFIEYVTPIFWINPGIDSSIFMLKDEFRLKIDTTIMTENDLVIFNSEFDVEIIKRGPSNKARFTLRVTKTSPYNALDMANLYQDSLNVLYAVPSFRLLMESYYQNTGEQNNEEHIFPYIFSTTYK